MDSRHVNFLMSVKQKFDALIVLDPGKCKLVADSDGYEIWSAGNTYRFDTVQELEGFVISELKLLVNGMKSSDPSDYWG